MLRGLFEIAARDPQVDTSFWKSLENHINWAHVFIAIAIIGVVDYFGKNKKKLPTHLLWAVAVVLFWDLALYPVLHAIGLTGLLMDLGRQLWSLKN